MSIPADTADAVLLEVETVLMAADPRFWLALEDARDGLCRDHRGSSFPQFETLPALSVEAVLADGRVREQAVRLLAESGSLAVLPILGLRAADWVPQARDVARGAISRRLDDDVDAAALAVLAPMALLLGRRQQGRWLAEQVTGRLANASASSQRLATRLLASPDFQLRRAAYQALADAGSLGLERAVQAALHDRDIIICSRCAGYAARRLALDADSTPLIRQMLASRTPLVRVEALAALNRLGEFDTIQDALADSNGLVRGTVRFYLKPHGVVFAEIYRRLLSNDADAVTSGAVAGLAEVGTAADADVITALLRHPRVKVRVEAIRALQTLAPTIDVDQMLTLIEDDPSPSVTRQATAAILARGSRVDAERLLTLLEPSRPMRIRLAAWKLLASRDTAWRLAVDVMLLADPDDTVAAQAGSDLSAAMQQQLYTKPSGKPAELLAAHLPDADRFLPPAAARLLRFILDMPHPAEPAELVKPDEPATARRIPWLRRR